MPTDRLHCGTLQLIKINSIQHGNRAPTRKKNLRSLLQKISMVELQDFPTCCARPLSQVIAVSLQISNGFQKLQRYFYIFNAHDGRLVIMERLSRILKMDTSNFILPRSMEPFPFGILGTKKILLPSTLLGDHFSG